MAKKLKLTFLGTGTSQGVPVIGCSCDVCRSADPRDNRLRTSAMVEIGESRFIIDAGPDFRVQLLREGVSHISAILLTHKHKDHIGGIDDVRALNFVDYPQIHIVNIYATADTLACVRKDYDYAFFTVRYRGTPEIALHTIDPEQTFTVDGVEITPIRGRHAHFEVTGYRFGDVAYMTDFKEIEKYQTIKLIILNGTIESIISTISTTYASEFAEAKMALLQVSTPTVDALKMKSMQALLRSLQPTERPLNIIWGTKADPEIAQGEAEIFVVYAAD
jgi:phosphoribosyl 1,2-cyclic phosphate phosphodiesterase